MNILQVVPELNAGGVERTTIEIAHALTTAGYVPHVASMGGRLEDELRDVGGILHRLRVGSKNPMSLRRNTKALINIIKTRKIDIVHARSRAPAWPAKAAAKATNTPFITTYHGIYNARSGLKRRYNAVMAKGDIVIANSNFTKDHIIREHKINAGKIVVIARGVDMDIFDPALVTDADITQIKQDWGVGNSSTIVLPGRLTRWKGQLVAVDALKQLHSQGINTALVLLGDAQGRDDYVAEIKSQAYKLGLSDKIILAGHSRSVPTALAAADVVISASTDPEAFGRVMAEAQAMQRLVVASDHGGARETVIEGKGGRLVTPGDPQALADGIADILGLSKSEYTNRALAARKRIGLHYSAQTLKAATLAVYAQVLHDKGGN